MSEFELMQVVCEAFRAPGGGKTSSFLETLSLGQETPLCSRQLQRRVVNTHTHTLCLMIPYAILLHPAPTQY